MKLAKVNIASFEAKHEYFRMQDCDPEMVRLTGRLSTCTPRACLSGREASGVSMKSISRYLARDTSCTLVGCRTRFLLVWRVDVKKKKRNQYDKAVRGCSQVRRMFARNIL